MENFVKEVVGNRYKLRVMDIMFRKTSVDDYGSSTQAYNTTVASSKIGNQQSSIDSK